MTYGMLTACGAGLWIVAPEVTATRRRVPFGSLVAVLVIVAASVLTQMRLKYFADTCHRRLRRHVFWWMGEHGSPRLDTSEHIYFTNDQLAVRFIEEIDFDYAAVDATAALMTAASQS